jgi:ferredoxin
MRDYKRTVVYFASGTGNSYRTARWFFEACLERGSPSSLIPVDKASPDSDIDRKERTLVGLSFPTHGLLPPWSVIKFLFKMPRKPGAHFLCLPTRGSFFIGPLLVPGAAGLASFLPSLVLLFKGYGPRGVVSFDMPANMTFIHPRLTPRHAERVIARARRKFDRNTGRFFSGGWRWLTLNNLYELIWSAAVLRYIPLFLPLYLIMGRFFMGKIMFPNRKCTGCGTCVKSCPAGALVLKGKGVKRPYWRYNCEACLRCLNSCPRQAVSASLSWGVVLWYVAVGVSFGGAVLSWISGYVPFLESLRNWWMLELFDSLFYYPAFLAAYFLFHHLTRLRPVSDLFYYLSPDRFFIQYLAPGTTLKDLTGRRSEDPALRGNGRAE